MSDYLAIGGILGGIAAMGQLSYTAYKGWRGGELRKGQAEAAKASLDALQAEASLPHVTEALKLGNVAEAVAVQQQIINGLRDHASWQDEQLQAREEKIKQLEERLAARDQRINDLEERVSVAERSLAESRAIIDELRETSRTENGPKRR